LNRTAKAILPVSKETHMDPLVTTGLVTALILVIVGGYFLMRPEKN